MLVVLNGYPGVGKLTIAQELTSLLGGRLLDIHTVYNVAFALTEFKSPDFMRTVEQIEAIAYGLVRKLPDQMPVVMTTVLAGESEWGNAEWDRLVDLGRDRPPFCVVHVHCDLDENIRRIEAEGRGAKRKPRDPDMARRNHKEGKPLMGSNAANLLEIDVTSLSPAVAAQAIENWLKRLT
ncbi:AAA family ATPase [Devosia riboflavina]